jgi:hypothetical protein
MTSILKEDSISIDLSKPFSLKKFVNINDLINKLNTNSSLIINQTRINKVNGLFYVKSFKNIDNILNTFLKLNLEVNSLLVYIENLMLDKEMIIKKPIDVLTFAYIDLLFNYYLLKSTENLDTNNIYLTNISKIIDKKTTIKTKKEKSSGNSWIQSTLMETALGNIEWVRDGRHPYISHKANKYLNEINAKLVEIPKDYELNKLEHSLQEIASILNEFKVEKREFIIRFRKIKKLKKTGLFIVSANTIILDPRATDSFKHELGHYVFENKIPVEVGGNILKFNDFKFIVENNRNAYSSLLNKHKIEDYKENSEIFAYAFESL